MTRWSAAIFSLGLLAPILRSSLAVLSSSPAWSFSSSSSSELGLEVLDIDMCLSYVSVGIIAIGEPEYGIGRCLMLPEFALLLSPVEPLPVELDAGGDGSPEGETAPGLSGGSGRSGILASLGSLGGSDPRNIADKGRLEEAASERGGIRVGAAGHQPRRT